MDDEKEQDLGGASGASGTAEKIYRVWWNNPSGVNRERIVTATSRRQAIGKAIPEWDNDVACVTVHLVEETHHPGLDLRKVEAYDRARARVKIEGATRAEYILRAEAAEHERDEAHQWCVDEAEKHDVTKVTLAKERRRAAQLEDALREVGDFVSGWTRPMTSNERLEAILKIVNSVLSENE